MTSNEEIGIQELFESGAWTDEIIVVDSFNTDKKMEVCLTSTDRPSFESGLNFVTVFLA